MGRTTIEWTAGDDGALGVTWNPVRGCARVSEGCRNCYAERVAARFSKPGQPFHGFAQVVAPRDSLDRVGGRRDGWTKRVELIEAKLAEPLRWRKPRRVFVNSMSDLFHEALPEEAIDRVFAVMALAPQHTFQVLTKRPKRMEEYCSTPDRNRRIASAMNLVGKVRDVDAWSFANERLDCGETWPLPNVWLGASVEGQKTADERVPLLLDMPAAVRFVSYEPALGPVDLVPWLFVPDPRGAPADLVPRRGNFEPSLDWIIVGGESGPGARPFDVAWARSAIAQCKAAGVACFVKQLGARPIANAPPLAAPQSADSIAKHGEYDQDPMELDLVSAKGGDPAEWPEDLRIREFPRVGART